MYYRTANGAAPRHSLVALLVAGLHAVVFCALLAGLAGPWKLHSPTEFQARMLPDPRPPAVTPTVPRPGRIDLPTEAHMPDVILPTDRDERSDAPPPFGSQEPGDAGAAASPRDAVRVPGGPGVGFPDAEDFYPAAAKRLEEQGISVVRVCVDAFGRLTAAPETVRSSGHARLDEGALLLARAGSGHYRPSTEDGRPVSSCYGFRVRFQLRY